MADNFLLHRRELPGLAAAGCKFAPRCPLAFERCREQPPIADGHLAACWRAS